MTKLKLIRLKRKKKKQSETKHWKDKLILSACSCRTYRSKSKVGPTQNISYFRDSVLYFRFIIASRVGEEEEDEGKKEEMEGQEQQNKTRVVKVDSLESWDFYVTQATNQGTPVSFLINFTNFQTTVKLDKLLLLLSGFWK